jgi:hypothetical protein
MNIYRITVKQLGESGKFPWVISLGPLSDISYTDRLPLPLAESEKKFLQVKSDMKSGLYIESGSVWSDILGYGGMVPECFYSERIVKTLEEEKIPLFNVIHAPVAQIENRGKKLREIPAPNYYLIEAHPGILRDWEEMGYVLNPDGTPNRNFPPNPRRPECYKASSWRNIDIFCPDAPLCSTAIYCTERIVDLAIKHQWTNIAFEPVRVV